MRGSRARSLNLALAALLGLLGTHPGASLVIVALTDDADSALIARIETLVEHRHSPGFALRVSGVPWAVELIRRHLERDLRVFSTAALAVFGLAIAAIYRSARIVAWKVRGTEGSRTVRRGCPCPDPRGSRWA